mmetsp:Transcript_23367/g.60975  ORF Transcript_23367/g.60975 Transcript_23367/m.60975 type:complete len:244 (-) Transcript_23367:43-774(-)
MVARGTMLLVLLLRASALTPPTLRRPSFFAPTQPPLETRPPSAYEDTDVEARLAFARDGLCVVEDFFDEETFAACQRAARRQKELKPETLESVAVGRLGCFLEPRDPVVVALSRPDSVERLRRICGDDRLEPADFPVELRRYPVGSSMGWHKDEVLYEEPQLEVVLTLENTSDSQTRWERADGSVRGAWLPPNSLLLVKAEGATHGVTTVRRGDRLIAKFVLTASPIKLQAWYDNILSYQAQP